MTNKRYEKLAATYLRLVRSHSPTAALEIEKIQAAYGARTAYYAALALSMVIHKVKHQGWGDTSDQFTFQLNDTPEALPLYLKAVEGLTIDMQQNATQG